MERENSIFKTKDGRLTIYSFNCGYIEVKEIDDDNRISMSLEPNGYHIKGFKNGKHFWAILEHPAIGRFPLKEARKAFDLFLTDHKLIVPRETYPMGFGYRKVYADRVYKAESAYKYPDWEEKGLIFVGDILLSKLDYYKINW